MGGIITLFNLIYDFNLQVSYLPLSHVAANLLDLVIILSARGTTYFAEKTALRGTITQTLKVSKIKRSNKINTIKVKSRYYKHERTREIINTNLNFQEVLPTMFFAVPRVYEKIQEKMMEVSMQTINGYLSYQ